MVTVSAEKCVGCGSCVRDCFPRNLVLREKKAQPLGECMLCGHCVAVCPTGAVSIPEFPGDSVVEQRDIVSPELLMDTIRCRRSIRRYRPETIQQETMAAVLEAGRFTPSAGNRQDVSYIVIQEELDAFRPLVWEGLDALADRMLRENPDATAYPQRWKQMYRAWQENPAQDGLFFNAPAVLVVTSDSKASGILAASNIELMAVAKGLGCLFSGFIEYAINSNPAARQFLGTDTDICICMLMGYPDVTYRRSAPRKPVAVSWR